MAVAAVHTIQRWIETWDEIFTIEIGKKHKIISLFSYKRLIVDTGPNLFSGGGGGSKSAYFHHSQSQVFPSSPLI